MKKSAFENEIFWCQPIFSVNFDFKNGCKNKFEDNNEKSSGRFKNRVPPKIDFRAEWTHESIPTAWELIAVLEIWIFENFEDLSSITSFIKITFFIERRTETQSSGPEVDVGAILVKVY